MKKLSTYPLMKGFLVLILLVLSQVFAGFVFAQNGTIRGTIYEESTGEPLYGVSVLVKETSTGAVTDFDGKFEIKVTPGSYTLQVSYISYASINLTEVVVKAGEVNVIGDLLMADEASDLEAVTDRRYFCKYFSPSWRRRCCFCCKKGYRCIHRRW